VFAFPVPPRVLTPHDQLCVEPVQWRSKIIGVEGVADLANRLASTVGDEANRVQTLIKSIRHLRLWGSASTPHREEATIAVLQYTHALQYLQIRSMVVDIPLIGLLNIQHSHTLCHLFLHIVLSHDSGTIAIEALRRLETLALVFETNGGREPEHGILRPFGKDPETFRHLVCYQFQISSSCSDLECTRLLQFLARSRFRVIHTIIIDIPTAAEPRMTALRLLAFFSAHHSHLCDIALAVVPSLIPLLLPKIYVPSVCIAVHHHFTAIGKLVSSELQHFTLGPCHASVPEAARPLIVLGFLSDLYSHLRYRLHEHKLTTIKLYDLSSNFALTDRYDIMIKQMAHAFLEIGINIQDASGHDAAEVKLMLTEFCLRSLFGSRLLALCEWE
jgi:hypothetical protein